MFYQITDSQLAIHNSIGTQHHSYWKSCAKYHILAKVQKCKTSLGLQSSAFIPWRMISAPKVNNAKISQKSFICDKQSLGLPVQ